MSTKTKTHEDRGVAGTVTVCPVEGSLDLYCKYQGQTRPQPCHIQLDLESGELSAGYNPEIGNAVPMGVFHGIVRRWAIPALKADVVNDLLGRLAPDLQALLDDESTKVYWDGSNRRGRCDDEHIWEMLDRREWYPEDQVQVWDAGDWYGGLGGPEAQREQLGITSATTDEELQAIVDGEDVDVLEGGLEYLQGLRDEIEEED